MHNISRRGLMFVLSSPSGAGKTAITKRLLQMDSGLTLSISVTTRQKRPGEVEGQDYFFITKNRFQEMVIKDELLENAKVFGHYYGTIKQQVFKALNEGKDVLFDIDWQGAQQLNHIAGADLVSAFILPPSLKELEERLRARSQDSEANVLKRMSEAANELSHWAEYDYVFINHNLEESVHFVRSILLAERLRKTRQGGLADFVNGLRSGS